MSLRGSYYWTTNGPYMRIDVGYTQTGRTSSSATYQVTMAVYFTSSGWHGYGLSANVNINGATQALRIKEPSTTWRGAGHKGTWTFTVTAPAGTGGGTLPASIAMWGTEGDNTNIQSGARTVTLSTWNTAPTWTSDDANVNGWKENKTIPENTGAVTVNLPSASDKEGNTIKYDVYRYVNGASNSKIATGITSRTVSDNISSFGQGSQIKYLIKCNDGSLWASGDRWTWTYTKNKFTPASISTSSSIGYNTTSISLNVSGASNTNGNTTFSYRLTNTSGLTIHNGDFTPASGKVTFSIYGGSGTRPSTPHIDLADLKSYTAKGIYQGTLVLRLTTSNAYGSSDYRDVSIPIDLRIAPVPATLANPTGAITVAGSSYFVFNRSTVGVSWSGATDKLGAGALSYELYYRYGSGSWNRLVSTSGTSWSGTLPQVTSATTCSFKVVATTTYGYSATSAEKSITMHYYNKPKVSYSAPNRTTSEFSVVIASITDTSITSVAISSRSFVGLSGKSTTFSGANTTIKDTGLSGDSNYTLVVTVTDNSGLSGSTTTLEVPVTAYIPIMSITDKGISINTTADPAYKLTIGGSLRVNDTICSTTGRFNHGNNTILRSNGNSTIVSCINGFMYFRPNGDTSSTNQVTISTAGVLDAPNVQVNGNNVYHTGRKPSAADVGALPTSGGSRLVVGTASSTDGSNAQIEVQAPNSGIPRIALHSVGRTRASIGAISGDGVDVITERSGTLKIQNANGYLDIGCRNDGYAHYSTDRANHWFNTTVRVEGEIYAGSGYNKQVFHTGWCGNVPDKASLASNLNSQLTSGWYSVNPSTSGRPSGVDYGVVLQIRWYNGQDFYQILLSSDRARIYTRGYVNGGYTGWSER